jgi:exodeoxyribonuclease V alpha subunit
LISYAGSSAEGGAASLPRRQENEKQRRMHMQTIDEALNKLKISKFRAGFALKEKDKAYVREKGMDTIRRHAQDFIRQRLAPAVIPNDGKQTPMHGHPVFIAQHACACCCRGCLNKWYRVPKGSELNERQQEKIVNLLMAWIQYQMQGK